MEPIQRILLFFVLVLAALEVALVARACSIEPAFHPTDYTAFQERVDDLPDGASFDWNGNHYIVIDE